MSEIDPREAVRLFAQTLKMVEPERFAAARKLFLCPKHLSEEKAEGFNVLGMKVLVRDYVPENELWLVDEKGNVLQKVICLLK